VSSIIEEVEEAIKLPEPEPDDHNSLARFNFIASASFRGATGCSCEECLVRKSESLARYAAAFCDRLVVPIRVTSHSKHASQSVCRDHLSRGLRAIAELRPVIDAGIVIPVRATPMLCPHCFQEVAPQVERIKEVARELTDSMFQQFSMEYVPRPKGKGSIIIQGPEEFIEHGKLIRLYDSVPQWLRQAHGSHRRSPRLTEREMMQVGFVQSLMGQMAADVFSQSYYGDKLNVSYLTDRVGEAQFLKLARPEDRLASRTAGLCAQMTHSIPLFMDLPLARILRIRKEESEAFDSYRAALGKILSEHVTPEKEFTELEARELYMDTLEPQLMQLQQQARNEQKQQIKKSALTVGITTAVVAIGVHSGLLPNQLEQIVKAIGGLKVLAEVAETVASVQKNPLAVRNSNLYFLLKLRQ